MNNFKLLFGLLLGLMILSCSSDDDNNNGELPNETENGFTFNGEFFPTSNALLNDGNTMDDTASDISIILANVNPLQTSQNSGINYVFITFQGVDIEAGTITNITDYQILENANFSNFEFSGGNTILDIDENGLMITSGSLTISSVSSTNVDLTYSLNREDGETITGNYSGTYINTSN